MKQEDRLTESLEYGFGECIRCDGKYQVGDACLRSCPLWEKQINYLAAYEDTGLSPEEAEQMKAELSEYQKSGLKPEIVQAVGNAVRGYNADGKPFDVWCRCGDGLELELRDNGLEVGCFGCDKFTSLKELMELHQAKEEGRLVELPCKVGDRIYSVDGEAYTIFDIGFKTAPVKGGQTVFFNLRHSGKIWFPTKEEAAKAALERKEK